MKRLARSVLPAKADEKPRHDKRYRARQLLRAWPVLLSKSDDIRAEGLQLRRLPVLGGGHETKLVSTGREPALRGLAKVRNAVARKLRERINAGRLREGVNAKDIKVPKLSRAPIQARIDASVKRAVKLGLGKLARAQGA